jgi:hypothetical protein
MTLDLLPLPLPTLPGSVSGIVAADFSDPDRHVMTVQCSGCYATKTGIPIIAAGWALFPGGNYPGYHDDGVRLCRDCRKACGCYACERTGR